MIKRKVCNALIGTHYKQKCYICGATPKMMNGELKDLVVKKEHYDFVLSTLHGLIRFFFLSAGYRLTIVWILKS